MIDLPRLRLRARAGVALVVIALSACHGGGATPQDPLSGSDVASPRHSLLSPNAASAGAVKYVGFGLMSGLTLDSRGDLYAADRTPDVKKVSNDGRFSMVHTNLPGVQSVAVDPSGNVYLCAYGAEKDFVEKIAPDGTIEVVRGGFNQPQSLATDGSGNLYVADTGNNVVKKVTPAGVVSLVGSGFTRPSLVAVDPFGNVYVAEGNVLKEVTASGKTVTLRSSFRGPLVALAVDPYGTIYVANGLNPHAVKLAPHGALIKVGPTFYGPGGIAVDGSGTVYLGRFSPGGVVKVAPDGKTTVLGRGSPYAVAAARAGELYIAAPADHRIYHVQPSGRITYFDLGFSSFPIEIAVKRNGTVYWVGPEDSALHEIAPNGNTSILKDVLNATAIATDARGELYTARGFVYRISPDGKPIQVSSQASYTTALAVSASGKIFTGSVNEPLQVIAPNATVTYDDDVFAIESISIDPTTDLPYVITQTGNVWRGMPPKPLHHFRLGSPSSTAFDAAGTLYAANEGQGTVSQYTFAAFGYARTLKPWWPASSPFPY